MSTFPGQIRGRCIFCGGHGLSKQHVWPDWFRNVVLRTTGNTIQHTFRIIHADSTEKVLVQPTIREKDGHPGVRKIRNICRKCNSGWMSNLETRVKQPLSNLLLAKEITLGENELHTISTWSVMTSIVAEFLDIPTIAIPENHREYLMNNLAPPESWQIWLGWYKGEQWRYAYRHWSYGIFPKSSLKQYPISNRRPNTQYTFFVAGELLIITHMNSEYNYGKELPTEYDSKIVKIWPLRVTPVRWPLSDFLTDMDMRELSRSISIQP